jgi:ankyrin repeat protein
MILKAGASLDLYDPDTQSPVQMAFDTGNLDVAKCLIDEGANLFASGKDGRNTLQVR